MDGAVCMRVPASVDARVHISVCLLKLLSPLNPGDVPKIPGICLVCNQSYIGFSVSGAESKPQEIQLRTAVPVKQKGKGFLRSGGIIKALERQWAWLVL